MPMPHLLLVDDDAQIRRLMTRALGRYFVVECVADVTSALELTDNGALFDVILCDLRLPGMSGRDLYTHLKRRSPELAARMVIFTGAEPASGDPFAILLGERYIMKCSPISEVAATLQRVAFPRLVPPLDRSSGLQTVTPPKDTHDSFPALRAMEATVRTFVGATEANHQPTRQFACGVSKPGLP